MENTIPFSYSLTQIQKDLQRETNQIVSPKHSKESLFDSKDLEEYNSEQSSKQEIIKIRNNNSLVEEIKQIKEKLQQQIGIRLFDEIYEYISKLHLNGSDFKQIKLNCDQKFGKQNQRHCFNIEQLIFQEKNLSKKSL